MQNFDTLQNNNEKNGTSIVPNITTTTTEQVMYVKRMRENIPQELKEIAHWVPFKLEWTGSKYTKVPKDFMNGHTMGVTKKYSNRFLSFEQALHYYLNSQYQFDGIGFVFTDQNNIMGIDIDDCYSDGTLHDHAREILFSSNSYAEFSPSHKGIHIILKGKMGNGWRNKVPDKNTGITYEMYDDERYFTFTGTPIIQGRDKILEWEKEKLETIYNKFWASNVKDPAPKTLPTNITYLPPSHEENCKYLKRGMEKDSNLIEMLNGDHRSGDESDDDFALLCKLAFWSNKDQDLMFEAFVNSNYYNSKDQKHLKKCENRKDYIPRTIQNAIKATTETAKEKDLAYQAEQQFSYETQQMPQQQPKFNFKFLDDKNKPYKIWQNVADLIESHGISISFDEIKRKALIEGAVSVNFDDLVLDIHSLCVRNGLSVTTDFIGATLNRISNMNPYNPITDFLVHAHENWDGQSRIKQLCDTLTVNEDFPIEFKEKLIRKWLVSTVRIAHNKGNWNAEGLLVLQGKQGMGKTTWVGHLIPHELEDYYAKGVRLQTDNKDSVFEAISNWIVELGELDGTLKSDQAALKAFFTLNIDVQRRPYAKSPSEFPRRASFFGTVNKANFLKDETGDRRYWILPVIAIDNQTASTIDSTQLWGEVMELWTKELENHYLNEQETKELYELNGDYRVKNEMQLRVEVEFNWDADPSEWTHKTSAEIADKLGLRSTSGLQEAITSCGGTYKKVKNKRGYITPPFKSTYTL